MSLPTIRDLAVATIDAQCVKGLAKYGKPLDTATLSPSEIAQHLVEEQADGLQYATKLGLMVRDMEAEIATLRAENARLRTALLPLAQMAQGLLEGQEAPLTDAPIAPAVAPACTDRCEACGFEVCECEALIQPPPPEPVVTLSGLLLRRRAYTARELAEVLGVHKDSIANYKRCGLLPEPLPGTGSCPQKPALYEFTLQELDDLKERLRERRSKAAVNGGKTAAAVRSSKAKANTPKPKELYPETPYHQHVASALKEAETALSLKQSFGLVYHTNTQLWRTAPLGPLEPGWSLTLRLEVAEGQWVGSVPISCRGHWTGKVALSVLDTLRQTKAVR